MYISPVDHIVNMQELTIWVAAVLLFMFGLSSAGGTGVIISPCGNDKVTEVVADQETVFTCTAQGRVQWRLQINGSDESELLATCEYTCQKRTNFSGLLIASTKEARHSSSMTITSVNRSNIVKITNGSLLCVLVNEKSDYLASAECALNYVYPPDGVSCIATNTSWSVTVSCVISSVYSSRKHYTCHLHRQKLRSTDEALELVNKKTSPTSEMISNNEVKMSGSCQFNTKLPAQEGQYTFHVAISPGGRTYTVNYTAGYKWITAERPVPPKVSCGPQPFVLKNTNITCTCDTTSLGQPAGFLRWITGSKTNHEEPVREEQLALTSHGLRYTQSLTLSDHANTWFRCDVIWGNGTIPGGKYTANVGYAAKPRRISFNGHEGTLTVKEGNHVHAVCESDGRPTPNVSIYNNDNNTLIWKESSLTNFTFITRCEDTATYACSAWNEFSSQSDEKTSLNISLAVKCKPRLLSSKHLPKITILHQTVSLDFNIIAYPVPHDYRLWENNNNASYNETKSSNASLTCKPDTTRRYLSRCKLIVFNTSSKSKTAIYLVQVSNAVGEENFTVEIPYDPTIGVNRNAPANHSTVVGSVGCVIILAVLALIAITGKTKKDSDRKLGLDEPELVPEISQLEHSVAPLYAVVDKKKQKSNSPPAHAFTTEEEIDRAPTEGATCTEPGCSQEPEVIYAVVDKVRVTLPEKLHQTYRMENWQSHGRWNEAYFTKDESCYINCDSTAIYQNDIQLAGRPPLSQNEATDKKGRLPARPPPCCPPDDGRWANQDGLTYTLPIFDVSDDVGHRAGLRGDKTDYCALRVIGKKILYLDKR